MVQWDKIAPRNAQQRRVRLIATPAIVAICCLVSIGLLLSGGDPMQPTAQALIRYGANATPLTVSGEWWRLWASTYLHIGLIHLGFNMFVLWNLGRLVERLIGIAPFIVMYTLSGIFGSLASVYAHPQGLSAGASGAVFGVFGCLIGVLLRRSRLLPPQSVAAIRKDMLTFIVLNLLFGLLVESIDLSAHIGGLVCGVACGVGLSPPPRYPSTHNRIRRASLTLVVGIAGILLGIQYVSRHHIVQVTTHYVCPCRLNPITS